VTESPAYYYQCKSKGDAFLWLGYVMGFVVSMIVLTVGYQAFGKHVRKRLEEDVQKVREELKTASNAVKTQVGAQVKAQAEDWAGEAIATGDVTGPDLEAAMAEGIDGMAEAFLGKLEGLKTFALLNMIRNMFGDCLALGALLARPDDSGTFCDAFWGFKLVVGIGDFLMRYGIATYKLVQMRRNSGEQAFYPGAMSNKLYELATGSKMFATLPDTDHSGENRGRVNFGTKWAISSGGQLLSLVVLLQQMQMWMEVIKPGSEARTYIALAAGLGALVLKFPEFVCYYYFFLLQLIEGTYLWHVFFTCGLVCGKGYDENDEKEKARGKIKNFYDTRQSPPDSKSACNGCAKPIEAFLFKGYAWVYYTLDNPWRGFWMFKPRWICGFWGPPVKWICGCWGSQVVIPTLIPRWSVVNTVYEQHREHVRLQQELLNKASGTEMQAPTKARNQGSGDPGYLAPTLSSEAKKNKGTPPEQMQMAETGQTGEVISESAPTKASSKKMRMPSFTTKKSNKANKAAEDKDDKAAET
jgi:hypothetical protein